MSKKNHPEKGLLIAAHGSQRPEANREVRDITARVAKKSFCLVQHAFLSCAKPSIEEGIESLIKKGAKTIHVLPYFLVSGKHTTRHIPAIVKKKSKEHPSVAIRLLPHWGQLLTLDNSQYPSSFLLSILSLIASISSLLTT